MSEKNSQEKDKGVKEQDDHLSEALENEHKTVARTRRRQSDGGRSFLVGLAILIGLTALCISSYVFYEQYRSRDWKATVAQKVSSSENSLQELESLLPKMGEMNTRIGEIDRSIVELGEAGAQTQIQVEEKLEVALKAVNKKLGATSEDWILAEVEYLVRLANQRAILDSDTLGARNLLKAADSILSQSDIPAAFEVRQSIANDLMRFEKVELVDHQGIYAKLTAIYHMIDQLKQKRLTYEKVEVEKKVSLSGDLSWTDKLTGIPFRMWKDLLGLVDFRREDTPIKPLLRPEEEYYLKQNLALKIELARIALLRGNQTMYSESLMEAQSWISEHFDSADKISIASLKGLEETSAITIKTELPDVSESLTAIRRYMMKFDDNKHRMNSESESESVLELESAQ